MTTLDITHTLTGIPVAAKAMLPLSRHVDGKITFDLYLAPDDNAPAMNILVGPEDGAGYSAGLAVKLRTPEEIAEFRKTVNDALDAYSDALTPKK